MDLSGESSLLSSSFEYTFGQKKAYKTIVSFLQSSVLVCEDNFSFISEMSLLFMNEKNRREDKNPLDSDFSVMFMIFLECSSTEVSFSNTEISSCSSDLSDSISDDNLVFISFVTVSFAKVISTGYSEF